VCLATFLGTKVLVGRVRHAVCISRLGIKGDKGIFPRRGEEVDTFVELVGRSHRSHQRGSSRRISKLRLELQT